MLCLPINLLTGSFRHQPHGQPHQLHNPNYQPHDQPSARKHHMLRSMLAGKKEEPRTLGSPEQVHSWPTKGSVKLYTANVYYTSSIPMMRIENVAFRNWKTHFVDGDPSSAAILKLLDAYYYRLSMFSIEIYENLKQKYHIFVKGLKVEDVLR